jgi:methylmalonyl-CoA/ethylmalonyl-CoA epimerase
VTCHDTDHADQDRTRADAVRPPFRSGPAVLTGIDHVGVAVADLDEAIAFYTETFGMRCTHVETNPQQGVREAMMQVGESGDYVQLLAPLNAESTIAKFIERHGPGIQQVAFAVDDIARTSADLRDRGVRLLYDQPQPGTAGSLVNFVHPKDAGGVLVELVEPAAGATPGRSGSNAAAGKSGSGAGES